MDANKQSSGAVSWPRGGDSKLKLFFCLFRCAHSQILDVIWLTDDKKSKFNASMSRCYIDGHFLPHVYGFFKKKEKQGRFVWAWDCRCLPEIISCTGRCGGAGSRPRPDYYFVSLFFWWQERTKAAQQQNKWNFAFDKWVKGPPAIWTEALVNGPLYMIWWSRKWPPDFTHVPAIFLPWIKNYALVKRIKIANQEGSIMAFFAPMLGWNFGEIFIPLLPQTGYPWILFSHYSFETFSN